MGENLAKEELSKELLDVLACPQCKGDLDYNKKDQKLICKKCKLAYRVEEGIPIMLIDEAEKLK
ncbi:MAG: tetraacyldisaccharide 4'-kinase [Candidatus Diapherotrites archaeon CG08_land_8_20_14_0_20_34_12]|nr:MAG: tetraacyldisaccharide 4'-kinase [Candidatus Diapherotrites archaeon CG08_land_8_20_14_0_20_34_12]